MSDVTQNTLTPDDASAAAAGPRVRPSVFSSSLFPGAVMIALMLFGLAESYGTFVRPSAENQSLVRSIRALGDGRLTQTFEKNYERSLPARKQFIALANGMRYLIERGTGDEVRLGRGGWLFLAEELEYHEKGSANQADRARLIIRVYRFLERRGIRIVVVVVPDKARMYEASLRAGLPAYTRQRYAEFMLSLHSAGVPAVDLAAAYDKERGGHPLYYATDSHWNQEGTRIAAVTIADEIRRMSLDLPATEFTTVTTGSIGERNGDLLRLMGLDKAPSFIRPAGDRETPLETREAASSSVGLFDDTAPAVTLVGTSYSTRANFHGFLQQELHTRVLNLGHDNSAFCKSLSDYLRNEAFLQTPPRLIIWELPERFLQIPIGKDEAALAAVLRAGGAS